ncbi:MAG: MarR family transcriptional regulator [Lachnospiraceae bacterium]|nr:MarR family transcriptional regulator [Lachnospiraceae bacterium]
MNLGKETETLEFKKTAGEIKESMKSISSMLNKHGIGTVYYGVARDGEVCAHQPEEYAKKNLESVIRNEKIAKMLYLNHSIEQFGSGFRRISSYCKDAGLKYSYEMDDYGFKFIIYRKKFQSDIQSDIRSDISNVTLNDTEKSILTILKHDPATSRDEMAERVSRTVRTVQRTLDSLRKKGYIQREGSKSNPRWTVLK